MLTAVFEVVLDTEVKEENLHELLVSRHGVGFEELLQVLFSEVLLVTGCGVLFSGLSLLLGLLDLLEAQGFLYLDERVIGCR